MATILVVDDNAVVARMLARILESKGHRTLIACSGPEALQAAGATPPPDLILLDLCMPEMDGLEVLRRLKSAEGESTAAPALESNGDLPSTGRAEVPRPVQGQHAPPVIFFSAIDDPAVIASAFRHGACDYWVKASFKFDDLPKAIKRHLAGKQTEQ